MSTPGHSAADASRHEAAPAAQRGAGASRSGAGTTTQSGAGASRRGADVSDRRGAGASHHGADAPDQDVAEAVRRALELARKASDTPELAAKRADEVAMVSQMIALWCRGHHAGVLREEGAPTVRLGLSDVTLCPECTELWAYALARLGRCPHMGTKTFCSVCPTHCYKPDMRERIREVMRWSGPRMLLYRPIPALRHALITIQSKM